MCCGLPWHHGLQPPHGVEDSTVPTTLSPLAIDCILAAFSSIFTVFLAWHCAFHAPAFRGHWEIFATLGAGTCAGSRAWKLLYVPFFPVAFSHLGSGVDKQMWNVTEFWRVARKCSFVSKRCLLNPKLPCMHCPVRFLPLFEFLSLCRVLAIWCPDLDSQQLLS